jgi:hypothetical protein
VQMTVPAQTSALNMLFSGSTAPVTMTGINCGIEKSAIATGTNTATGTTWQDWQHNTIGYAIDGSVSFMSSTDLITWTPEIYYTTGLVSQANGYDTNAIMVTYDSGGNAFATNWISYLYDPNDLSSPTGIVQRGSVCSPPKRPSSSALFFRQFAPVGQ